MQKTITTNSPEETEQLAAKVGAKLRGNEVIELVSDVGGGKTTFVRGLASGAGSQDKVASPTFTLSRIYETDKLKLHHFDMYRVAEAGLLEFELADALEDEHSVLVVEWAEVVAHVLPEKRLTVRINKTGEESRTFQFDGLDAFEYIGVDLC